MIESTGHERASQAHCLPTHAQLCGHDQSAFSYAHVHRNRQCRTRPGACPSAPGGECSSVRSSGRRPGAPDEPGRYRGKILEAAMTLRRQSASPPLWPHANIMRGALSDSAGKPRLKRFKCGLKEFRPFLNGFKIELNFFPSDLEASKSDLNTSPQGQTDPGTS